MPLYHWILEHHDTWVERARERPATHLQGSEDWNTARDRYFQAARDGQVHDAIDVAVQSVHTPEALLEFFNEVVFPAMSEIGLKWELGELSPAKEHRATSISLRMLASLQARLTAPPAATRGRALVGAAPNEYHELGAQMLAMLLEYDGWEVSYLGADTSAEDFLGLAVEERPRDVAISLAMPYNVDRAAELVALMRTAPELEGTRIMVGGHAFADIPEVGAGVQADAVLSSLQDGLATARSWSTG